MNRTIALVTVLAVVLVGVLFWFFAWKPKSDEIDEIEAQQEAVEQQQVQLRQQIEELKQVRATAPEAEAAIVAAESVVPRDLALASALRQFQLAADESGVELVTVSPSRPEQVVDAQPGLARLGLSVTLSGSYFQLVDFLRRVEDPAITPRGVVWDTLNVAPEEFPTLTATASGVMFALLPAPPAPPPEETATPGEEPTEVETTPEAIGASS